MEYAPFVKDVLLAFLVVYTVYTIYSFQRFWTGNEYYRATMLKIDSTKTVVSFGFMFLGTLFSTMGAFTVGFGMMDYTIVLFDLSIVSWAVFFFMINTIVSKGGSR